MSLTMKLNNGVSPNNRKRIMSAIKEEDALSEHDSNK